MRTLDLQIWMATPCNDVTMTRHFKHVVMVALLHCGTGHSEHVVMEGYNCRVTRLGDFLSFCLSLKANIENIVR